MKTIEQITQIAESLGWKIEVDESDITFSRHTTAGQDFSFSVNKNKNITDEVLDYYEGYDPSEEAILWCDNSGHGKNGAPHHLKDIIADMEEAKAMVKSLQEAIDTTVTAIRP